MRENYPGKEENKGHSREREPYENGLHGPSVPSIA